MLFEVLVMCSEVVIRGQVAHGLLQGELPLIFKVMVGDRLDLTNLSLIEGPLLKAVMNYRRILCMLKR